MEEANKRVLRPYRKYLPTPEWFRFRRRMATLNAFLVGLLRQRWADRQAGRQDDSRRPDILDRVLQATEVGGGSGWAWLCAQHVLWRGPCRHAV